MRMRCAHALHAAQMAQDSPNQGCREQLCCAASYARENQGACWGKAQG